MAGAHLRAAPRRDRSTRSRGFHCRSYLADETHGGDILRARSAVSRAFLQRARHRAGRCRCVGLTMLAFFLPGFTETEAGDVGVKASISAAVVGLTTFLITDRKNAEERLRESEGQWREVFEHNPVMYFMVDATGTILSVNGFGAAQLGYTTAELVGKSVLNIFLEEEREVVKDQLATCVEELGR